MAIRPSLLHSRRPTLNWTTALTLAREQTRQRPTRPDALPRSDEAAEIVGVSMRIARAKTSSPAGLGRVFRCRYASDARHDSNPRYSDLVPVRYLLDPDRLAGLGPNTPWIRPIPLARPERFELPTFGSVDPRKAASGRVYEGLKPCIALKSGDSGREGWRSYASTTPNRVCSSVRPMSAGGVASPSARWRPPTSSGWRRSRAPSPRRCVTIGRFSANPGDRSAAV